MKHRILKYNIDYYISYITNLNLFYNHFRGPNNQVSELMSTKGTLGVFGLLPVPKTRGRIERKKENNNNNNNNKKSEIN